MILNTTEQPAEGHGDGSMEFFIATSILTIIGVTGAIAAFIFSIQTRSFRIMRMSSPMLNMITCFGCLISYINCFMWSLPHLNSIRYKSGHDVICKIKPWLLMYSFTIIMAPCITKSWRVQQIFKYVPKKKVVIKDRILIVMVVTLLIVDTFLLALWTGIDFPSLSYQTKQSWVTIPGMSNPVEVITQIGPVCYSRHMPVWLAVVCVYKVTLLAYGVYVSWTIRSISIPSMNDSGTITLAITGTAVLGGATIALASLTDMWPHASDVCVVLGMWFCTTIILILVFLPKVLLLRSYRSGGLLSSPIGSQVVHSPTISLQQFEEDCYNLTAENRRLKHQLKQKEEELLRLREKQALMAEKPKFRSLRRLKENEHLHGKTFPVEQSKEATADDNHEIIRPIPVYHSLPEIPQTQKDTKVKQEHHWYDSDSSTLEQCSKPRQEINHDPRGDQVPDQENRYEKLKFINTRKYPLNNNTMPSHENGLLSSRNQAQGSRLEESNPQGGGNGIIPRESLLYHDISNCPIHGDLVTGYFSQILQQLDPENDRLSSHEIASAISESYDLDNDDEALSYISTCLSTIPSTGQKRRKKLSKRSKRRSVKRRKSTFTLPNDQYYPNRDKESQRRPAESQSAPEDSRTDPCEQNTTTVAEEEANRKGSDGNIYYIDLERNQSSASFL